MVLKCALEGALSFLAPQQFDEGSPLATQAGPLIAEQKCVFFRACHDFEGSRSHVWEKKHGTATSCEFTMADIMV